MLVVTAGLAAFVFRVNAPALAWTGCAGSTPVYARIEPTPPVGLLVENVYAAGSDVATTRTNMACVRTVVANVHDVRTTWLQPAGAEIGALASARNATAATRTAPLPAPVGRDIVTDVDGACVALLDAEVKRGAADDAPPRSATPVHAAAMNATRPHRLVTIDTAGDPNLLRRGKLGPRATPSS